MDVYLPSLFRAYPDAIAVGRRRTLSRLLVAFVVVKGITYVGFVIFFGLVLWVEWPSLLNGEILRQRAPDELALMAIVMLEVISGLQAGHFNLLSQTLGVNGKSLPTLAFARTLMSAVAAQDLAVAVPVTENSRTTPGDAASASSDAAPMIVTPLAHPMRSLSAPDAIYIVFGLGGAILLIALGVGVSVLPGVFSADGFTLPSGAQSLVAWIQVAEFPIAFGLMGYGLASIGVIVGIWALISLRYSRMERRDFSAQIDGHGLTIRQPGRPGYERHMAWNEVRGFARIYYKDAWIRAHDIYLLCAADKVILWEANPVSKYIAREKIQRQEASRAAALQLKALVAQRIQPQLVDVSAAVETMLATESGFLGTVAPMRLWNLPARARAIALEEGDAALAHDLWMNLHPNRRPPSAPSLASRMDASMNGDPRLTHEQRSDMLRLARACLPYLPTDEQMTPNPRKRWLKRAYWRFEVVVQCSIFVWLIATIALVIPHLFNGAR